MPSAEIQQVLANWIKQATEPPGRLAENIEPAQWVAEMFLGWWREQTLSFLEDAESATGRIRVELQRLGGWNNKQLENAMEEMTHLEETLADLRTASGFAEDR
jgi:hypothetical protein